MASNIGFYLNPSQNLAYNTAATKKISVDRKKIVSIMARQSLQIMTIELIWSRLLRIPVSIPNLRCLTIWKTADAPVCQCPRFNLRQRGFSVG
jgi:hypothetical protein